MLVISSDAVDVLQSERKFYYLKPEVRLDVNHYCTQIRPLNELTEESIKVDGSPYGS